MRIVSVDKFDLGGRVRVRRFVPNQWLMMALFFITPIIFIGANLTLWSLAGVDNAMQKPMGIISTLVCMITGFAVSALTETMFRRKYPSEILDAGG